MPELLSEINNLSIITPHVQDATSVPRYSNPPPGETSYQNWTMIEDVLSCNTNLSQQTQLSYMPQGYNSNGVIPAYQQAVCPSAAQQALLNMSRNPPNPNIYVPQQLITGQSFQSQVNAYNNQHPQYSTSLAYPPYAGSMPYMKNAKAADDSIPLIEGYAPPSAGTRGRKDSRERCIDCLHHVENCDLCKKISGHSTRKYWAGILLLIIIIGCLVAYVCHLKRKYSAFEPSSIGCAMLKGITIE